jgi:2,4-dienoyl-CoA reductase-like NADH-dependent reductase (Old Yellow Enzyme family)
MHLAPRGDAHDMGDSNLAATFGYVAEQLGKRKLAFLCARESLAGPRLGPTLKKAFGGPYVVNEGFTAETAAAAIAAGEADAIAFGKLFIANPDLPRRLAMNAPLNKWNSATFYSEGEAGYTDYPELAKAAE